MTAGHVSDGMRERINDLRKENIEAERAIFIVDHDGDILGFATAGVDDRIARIRMPQKPRGFTMTDEIDIGLYKILKKEEDLPYLRIRNSNVALYEEVVMCGYPGGVQSLNFSTASLGMRMSPVIQSGKIVSLFPSDNSPVPNGFQTDIVGTGGSSGSPIVDSNGDVVGIALQVLGADVMDSENENNNSTTYIAKVGLVLGLTTNVLSVVSDFAADYFERNIKDIPYPFDTTTIHPTSFRRL